jgi:hypothetical protein
VAFFVHVHGYDADGRLAMVSATGNTASYSYVAISPLADHIVFAHSGTTAMTTSNTYDHLNRLTGHPSVSAASSNLLGARRKQESLQSEN